MRGGSRIPVVVTVSDEAAARMLAGLLEDYFAELESGADVHRVSIVPIDDLRRGTVLYRVIQASRSVAVAHPHADLFFVSEDGQRWRLPPPAL